MLAINSSLEATKHKQAKEIRDLRRKLRESRLALPPRTYREFRLSQGPEELDDDDDDDDGDDDGDGEADKGDAAFMRVRVMLERLLEDGKRALESTPEDHLPSGGTKVLHEVEAQSWRDGGSTTDYQDMTDESFLDTTDDERALTPARAIDDTASEEEVEDLIVSSVSTPFLNQNGLLSAVTVS